MKKTLIALAALASTAAFAQSSVTISGAFNADVTKAKGSVANYGLGDANIKFGVTEDLGGGLSLTAASEIAAKGRTTANPTTRDASVTLAGGFGSVIVGDIEAGNGIIGLGYAGAPIIGADNGKVLGAAGNTKLMRYTSPAFNGFSVQYGATQAAGNFNAAQYTTTVAYANGPISAKVDSNDTTKRVRSSASYDLGVAKIGAGFSSAETGVPNSYAVGVSVPMGALTVGAAYSHRANGAAATDVGTSYALSKRTALQAAYQVANTEAVAAGMAKSTLRLRVAHTF